MTSLTPVRAFFGTALFSLVSALALPAMAQELSFGITTDLERGDFGGMVEFHGPPVLGDPGGLSGSWGVAARADLPGNAWVGAGFVLDAAIGDKGFVEASFMPGYYWPGDTDLGHNLQFRSLIGFGWNIAPGSAVILSLDHISNAGIDIRNPGAETVALRYRMSF
ncbi:MAG: Lipid A 3-O-deacylase (PagL) [Rhodobacteraceae bacterium HLUCCO18]|nr:MAG: Lipid A 3-O-deacylase (PagL) [Rhodobacteraceae bacterium HLUCCO18]